MNLGFVNVNVNLLVAYCGFTLLWISKTLSITVFQEARNLSETRMKFSDSLPLSDLNLELATSRIHLQSSFTLFFSSKSFWNVCPTEKEKNKFHNFSTNVTMESEQMENFEFSEKLTPWEFCCWACLGGTKLGNGLPVTMTPFLEEKKRLCFYFLF